MWASAGRNPATSQTPYLESEMNIKVTNLCSICAGTKELLTGKPCGCKDGTIHGELHFIRMEVFKAQEQRDAALKLADELRKDCVHLMQAADVPNEKIAKPYGGSMLFKIDELRAIFAPKEEK